MGFKKIIVGALTAVTVISGSTFTIDAAYAQSVSTKTTFSGDYIKFYAPAGKAVVAYDDANKNGEIKYLELDNLQRATGAYGYISKEMRTEAKERGRQDIKVDPVGWTSGKPPVPVTFEDRSYKDSFYNRSHLIADSLGGDPTKVNLVTGTRMQNVGWNKKGEGGMAYIEEKTRVFLDSPKGDNCPVYYAVTPNYIGSELLPRTVTVNAKSCDSTIDEQIVVDNMAPGYVINYMNGEFKQGDIPKDQFDGANTGENNNQENPSGENLGGNETDNNQSPGENIPDGETPGDTNSGNVETADNTNNGESSQNTDGNTSGNETNSENTTRPSQKDSVKESGSSNQSQTQIGGGTQSQSENGEDTTDDRMENYQSDVQDDVKTSTSSSDRPTNTSVSVNGGTPSGDALSELNSESSLASNNSNEDTAYGPKVDTGGQVDQGIIAKIISFFK